jgi:hypothetical protein
VVRPESSGIRNFEFDVRIGDRTKSAKSAKRLAEWTFKLLRFCWRYAGNGRGLRTKSIYFPFILTDKFIFHTSKRDVIKGKKYTFITNRKVY